MNEKEKMILAELQVQRNESLKAWDSLDNKLIAVFTVAAFFLVLLFTFKSEIVLQQFLPCLGVIIVALIGLVPRTICTPIRLEWEAIWDGYLLKSDDDAYQQLISNYLYTIEANNRIGTRKGWFLIGSMSLLVIQAFMVIISVL